MAIGTNRERVVEHLTDALDAEECTEKNVHIREALQLLDIEEREIPTT